VEPEERATDADLIRALSQEARLYSFFQVVQLLERARPQAAPLGQEGPASRETVRLRPSLSLAFPGSDVAAVEVLEDGETPRVLVETNFLGLYGSTSPLPSFYAEELLQDSSDDSLVRGVLDLFHHRLLSLLYRCWKKYRPYLQFRPDGRDEFSWRLFCLIGMGIDEAAARCALPARWLLRYCGLLNQRPRSAAALRCVISDFFSGLPVEVTSYAERWVTIPDESRCRLGSANCRLGVDLQVGERVEDRAGKFRVTLGPMDLDTYIDFLPGRRNFDILSALARSCASDLLAYEIQLDLKTAGLPGMRLARDGMPPFLGETTWLGEREEIVSLRVPAPDAPPQPLADETDQFAPSTAGA
jgi:type VI secretion system protein ImpH